MQANYSDNIDQTTQNLTGPKPERSAYEIMLCSSLEEGARIAAENLALKRRVAALEEEVSRLQNESESSDCEDCEDCKAAEKAAKEASEEIDDMLLQLQETTERMGELRLMLDEATAAIAAERAKTAESDKLASKLKAETAELREEIAAINLKQTIRDRLIRRVFDSAVDAFNSEKQRFGISELRNPQISSDDRGIRVEHWNGLVNIFCEKSVGWIIEVLVRAHLKHVETIDATVVKDAWLIATSAKSYDSVSGTVSDGITVRRFVIEGYEPQTLGKRLVDFHGWKEISPEFWESA